MKIFYYLRNIKMADLLVRENTSLRHIENAGMQLFSADVNSKLRNWEEKCFKKIFLKELRKKHLFLINITLSLGISMN